jgi:hypothetical protein
VDGDAERSGRDRLLSAVAVLLLLALAGASALLYARHERTRRSRARGSYRVFQPLVPDAPRPPKSADVTWIATADAYGRGFGGTDTYGDSFYARFDARGPRWFLFTIDVEPWDRHPTEGAGNFFTLAPPRPGNDFVDVADDTADLVRVVSRDGYFPCPIDASPEEVAAFARDLVRGKESVEHALVRLAKATSWDDLRARLAARLREGG